MITVYRQVQVPVFSPDCLSTALPSSSCQKCFEFISFDDISAELSLHQPAVLQTLVSIQPGLGSLLQQTRYEVTSILRDIIKLFQIKVKLYTEIILEMLEIFSLKIHWTCWLQFDCLSYFFSLMPAKYIGQPMQRDVAAR